MIRIAVTAAAMALAAAVPAYAQMSNDAMSSGSMMSSGSGMKMSAADKKTMTRCQGMSHDMMMKNKSCMMMMKKHPGMM